MEGFPIDLSPSASSSCCASLLLYCYLLITWAAEEADTVLEPAQLYAWCRDIESYSSSRKHCLRRPGVKLNCNRGRRDATFQTGSTHTAKTAPPAPQEMVWPLYHGHSYQQLTVLHIFLPNCIAVHSHMCDHPCISGLLCTRFMFNLAYLSYCSYTALYLFNKWVLQ
jgi:hypothetical protein